MLKKCFVYLFILSCYSLSYAQAPANDLCSGAILIPNDGSCYSGTTFNATDNNETGDCTTGTENAVWYKFVASATTMTVQVTGSANFDPVLKVLNNCGVNTSPSGGACIDNTGNGGIETRSLTGLTIGNTYYVQVHEYAGEVTSTSTFTVCALPPANECSGAQLVTLTSGTETCLNAESLSGLNVSSTPRPSCWPSRTYSGDKWYRFVAVGTDISIEIQNLDNGYADGNSLQFCSGALYGGTCSGLTLLNCSFVNTQAFDAAFAYYNLVPGQTYYIRVSGVASTGFLANDIESYNLCIKNNTVTSSNAGDCVAAVPICQTTNSFSILSNAQGNYENEINTAYTCTDKEVGSTWYTFTAQSSGNFNFLITPNVASEDFDWALFNITNRSCLDIATDGSMLVSCNATGGAGCTGNTGANIASGGFNIQGGGCGNNPPTVTEGNTPFNATIPVVAGNTYALYISNWSGTTNGYSINFSGSSAGVLDLTGPTLTGIDNPACGATSITIRFSENVLCSSLNINNFTLTGPGGPYTLSNLVGDNCANGGTYSKYFTATVSPAMRDAGSFTISYNGTASDICGNTTPSTSVTINVTNSVPNADITQTNFEVCTNSASLNGNLPSGYTGIWSSSDATITFTPATGASTTVGNLKAGANTITYVLRDASGCEGVSESIIISNNQVTTVADISTTALTTCNGSLSLSANSPATGEIGTWTIPSGASFSSGNANSTNITVANLPLGNSNITWTISRGTCPSSNETVVVTNSQLSTSATITSPANNTQVCTNTVSLIGNTPGTNETGTWTLPSGVTLTSGTVNSTNISISGLSAGNNTFTWTISSGGCPPSIANVVIINNTVITVASISTPNNAQSCDGTINLSANSPASGETGTWTLPSGATITSGTINATNITLANLPIGASSVTWTISRGTCPPSTSTINIVNNRLQTTATILSPANNSQVCSNTASLSANSPASGETGTWTLPSGVTLTSGTLNSTNISVTGLATGNNTFTWTISRGTCPPSVASIVIINNTVQSAAITTPEGVLACDGNIALTGNTLLTGETGTWSTSTSGASVAPTTGSSTTATLANGSNVITYTITKGSCSSSANVTLTNTAVTTANITQTSPLELCINSTTLNGNAVGTNEAPSWGIVSGGTGATLSGASTTTLTVSNLPSGNTVIRYTITKTLPSGNCTSFEDITLTNNSVQSAAITTPEGVLACDGNIALTGNTLLTGETGTWSTSTSGASVAPTTGSSTTATLANGSNVITYTITKGSCSSSANVTLTNTAVTTANITQTSPLELCINSTTLNGNAVGTNEAPSWGIVSGGTGATLSGASTTTLTVSNLPSGNTVIRYTITKTLPSGNCTSFEDITLTNNQISPVADITTSPQSTCGSCFSLNAVAGTNGASGLWTLPSGVNLTSGTTSSSAITACNLAVGANNFIWTLTKGTCTSTDNVSITRNSTPIISEIHTDVTTVNGSDGSIEVCINSGTAPYNVTISPASGTISNIGGNGSCTARFRISGLSKGNYTVNVTDANTCTAQIANIPINDPNCTSMTIQNVSSTNETCNENNNGSITIQVLNAVGNITYSIGNGVPNATNNLNPYTFNNLQAGSYTVQATDTRGCSVSYLSNPVVVTQPTILSTSSSVTNTTTVGGSDGVYCISVSGGTAPYNVTSACGTVSTGAGSCGGQFNLSGQAQGSCSFTITDNNGCTTTTSNTITDPTCNLSIQSISSTNVLCNGANNGTITINITGNRPPYRYSINGGTSFTTVNSASYTFNGLAPGSYNIQVKDAINCTVTYSSNPIVITQPSVLSASATPSPTSTVGGNDGNISVCINGGTAPYNVSYSPNTGSSSSVSGVCEGNFSLIGLIAQCYNITITDSKNCTFNLNNICVLGPNCSTMTIQSVNANNETCNQNNDGSIQIQVQNAVGNITYSIGNGIPNVTNSTNPYTFTGLQAGSYTVQVTDTRGCSVSYLSNPVVITQPNILLVNTAVQNVNTVGGSDGAICLTVSGGTPSYSVTSSCGVVSNGAGVCGGNYNISNLTATTCSFTVRDNNNCSTSTSATVNDPSCNLAITSVSNTNVLCNGANNGTITINYSGGTAPYRIYIDGGTTPIATVSTTTYVASNLPNGNYNIVVRDAVNCAVSYSSNPVIITQPNTLTASATPTSTTTVNGNDGKISICINGGTTPYTIAYTPNTGAITNVAGTCAVNREIIGLIAGCYTITITDANNCTFNLNNVCVQDPDCSTFRITNVTKTNETCNQNNNGSITITTTNGIGSLTYAIGNGIPNQVTTNAQVTFSPLSAGNYNVQVTDARGCVVNYLSNPVVITEPVALNATATVTNVSTVGGSDGALCFTIIGGTPNYSITSSCGTVVSGAGLCGGAYHIPNLTAGNCSYTVTDANGCSVSSTATINDPTCTLAITNVISSNLTCNSNNSGSISVTVSGGTPPYIYRDNGTTFATTNNTTATASGLSAGNHTITVIDATNCSVAYASNPVVLTEPDLLTVNVSPFDATTIGGADGKIVICVNGGTPSYTITVSPNSGTTNTVTGACNGNFEITGLGAGTYSITVRDVNGCTISQNNIVINEPNCTGFVVSNVTTTDITCNNNTDGQISITVNGGNPPYQYSIFNGAATQSSSSTNYIFTGLGVSCYTIRVTDASNCSISYANNPVCITEPTILSSTVVQFDPTTLGGSNGEICITPNGGTAPYNITCVQLPSNTPYTVSAGNGANCNGAYHVSNLPSGNYYIEVRDDRGCLSTGTITLNEPLCSSQPPIVFNGNNTFVYQCNGDGTATVNILVSGGFGPEYTITGNNGATPINASTTAGGNFSITVQSGNSWSLSAQDRAGCTSSNALSDTFEEGVDNCANCNTVSDININGNNTYAYQCNGDGTATLSFTASGGSGAPYNVSGSGFTTAVPNTASGTITLTVNTGNTWTITFTDRTGCKTRTLSDTFEEGVDNCANCNTVSDININGNNTYAYQCNGDGTATLSFTASGGSGVPYNVSGSGFTTAVPNTASGTITLTVNTGNTWTITFTDRTGCKTRTLSDTFEEGVDNCANCNTVSDININGNNTYAYQCNGDGTATLSFTASGGSGVPYNVSGSGFTTAVPNTASGTITLTVNTGNTWTITFTDRTGCKTRTLSDTFEEGVDNCANCNTVSDININGNNTYAYQCNGDGTATLSFTASGGGSGVPYNVSGSGFTTAVPNTASGTITLTVNTGNTWTITFTDRTGCKTRTLSDTFEEGVDNCANCNNVSDININGNNTYAYQCNGDGTATLSFTASGGSGVPYNVSGSGFTTAVPNTASGTITLTVNTGNTWTITFTDRTGCKTRTLSDTFEEGVDNCANCNTVSDININGNNTYAYQCNGDGTATLSFTASGGSGVPYNVSGSGFTTAVPNTASGTITLTVNTGNTWTITFTDRTGCKTRTLSDTFEEGVDACANCSGFPPITLNDDNTFEYDCNENGSANVELNITGGSGAPYTISLTVNGIQRIENTSTNTYAFNVINGDDWYVTVTDHLGCSSRTIGSANNPIEFINATADILINNQSLDSIVIDIGDIVSLRASGGLNYIWTPATWLNNPNVSTVEAKPEVSTWYTVTVSNENGCPAIDSVFIKVFDPDDCIESEYIFSPNGDGQFDTWVVTCLLLERPNVMEIFNRWGQKLISFTNYDSNWDGTVNGEPLPDGTYYFLFKGTKYNTSDKVVYRGTVTIIR